jgi:putative redox protein
MTKITATNGKENYLIEIQTPTGNKLVADEPIGKGGQDNGFSPKELLASALAACTSATVRMYCTRKGWDLKNIHIEIELIEEEGNTMFKRVLKFEGNISEEQQTRLLAVANSCPIHKILTNSISIDTTSI